MSDQAQDGLILFSEHFTNSPAFEVLFRDGMNLVEETAAYLDGEGRSEAKALERAAGLTYATESMRLTTRLMQLASWLLLHRAVREGEMTLHQANREKTKVRLTAAEPAARDLLECLPQQLQDLIARSVDLQGRVRRFDVNIHSDPVNTSGNPLNSQMTMLRAAFEG